MWTTADGNPLPVAVLPVPCETVRPCLANAISGPLLTNLKPEQRAGRFVFTTTRQVPAGVEPVASIHEDEGVTLVLARDQADRARLEYDYVAAMITLRVHSALDVVGLTAVVATRLADAGISCNVLAGYHHDHLFVPWDRGSEAVALLRELRGAATR